MRAVAAFLFACTLTAPAGAAGATPTGPIWDAFSKAVDRANDYTETIVAHEVKGDAVQDRVYHFFFKKPTLARTDIVDGPGRGGAAVWRGGDTIRGHQGGILSGIRLTLSIADGRAVDLRGKTIVAAIFAVLRDHMESAGTVTEGAGKTIDGNATDALTLVLADAAKTRDLTKEIVYISKATHLPVRHEGYEGDKLVEAEDFKDQVVNAGLPDSTFDM
jgi:outer membrane lipoprotein-sorting protein